MTYDETVIDIEAARPPDGFILRSYATGFTIRSVGLGAEGEEMVKGAFTTIDEALEWIRSQYEATPAVRVPHVG